ncbi:MAG TPA: hypothetical protein VNZ44_20360, partial [Pyrinomonadaceae bacterium]|nr:hypothetical protein [Pyrinomonadaceae bacterium]
MIYLYYLVVLAAIVVQIIVLVKLFQEKGLLHGILGFICGLYTFIWGWMNAGRLNIRNLMIIWTILLILLIILGSMV